MKALLTWRFWFTSPWWNLLRRKDYELAAKQFAFWAVVGMFFRLYLHPVDPVPARAVHQRQAVDDLHLRQRGFRQKTVEKQIQGIEQEMKRRKRRGLPQHDLAERLAAAKEERKKIRSQKSEVAPLLG